ncbi:hypothetical protein F8G81_12065 [Arthrobacter sp. CDRTa11]|uniref:hypothetical protein n=1 Tax=Arthrobacter sp. CDRTa11 TaxID=2651199 RepID=UPI002265F9C4|nr:hypothetical protein [Arthrobacter sp. CDRTa11]UZX03260.1 hypothetical protein F8G81_12065 [Arthrobacter sp. CDRTa11]
MSLPAAGNPARDLYRGLDPHPRLLSLPSQWADGMTREEAYLLCPEDSYVEYYGNQWLIVPFEPVEQPHFFVCRPEDHVLVA